MGKYDHKEPDSHPTLEDLAEITRERLESDSTHKRRMSAILGKKRLVSPLENRKVHLIAYMRDCILTEDWHGVSDAANDLRELAVEQRIVKTLFKSHEGQDHGPITIHQVK